MEWQPIETAPRDGTRVLGYGPDLGYTTPNICAVIYDTHSKGWYADQWDCAGIIKPTHWMPLPEPPA